MHMEILILPFTRGPSSTGVMTITEAKMQPGVYHG